MRGAAVLLVAVSVSACGGGASAPTAARAAGTPARVAAPDPCAAAPRGGDLSLHVLAGTPAVIVHVPDGLPAGLRVPLVLGLHGAGQDARGFEAESNLSNVADEHRFVVAYPQSWRARGFWQYPEPDNRRSGLRLLRATLDAVEAPLCVDPERVLVTGISSGGRMTYAAGCELADRILAIAPVSGGTRDLPPCHPARPISVIDTHGTRTRSSPTAAAGRRTTGASATSWPRGRGARAATRGRRAPDRALRDAPGLARLPRPASASRTCASTAAGTPGRRSAARPASGSTAPRRSGASSRRCAPRT